MSTPIQHHRTKAAGLFCIAMGLATSAVAQSMEEPRTRTWLQWQGTLAQVESTSRFSAWLDPASGSQVGLEDDLNLAQRNLINQLQFGRRIGDRWRLEAGYESNRRSGSTVLPRALDIGGQTFAQGTAVRSEALLAVLRVNGGYAFVLTPDTEVGLLFGGQSVRVSLAVQPPAGGSNYESDAVEGGLVPLLGLYGSHRLGTGAWSLSGRVVLGVDEGHYNQVKLGLDWQANRYLQFGLGYQFSRARLNTELTLLPGGTSYMDLNYRTHGPTVSVQLAY